MKQKCKCGGRIDKGKCLYEGYLIDCMQCDKCREMLFTPDQTKEIIRLRESNRRIEGKRKIIKVGSSIAAILPKKIEEFGVKEGLIDEIKVLSSRSLEIRFDKDIF